MTVPTSVTALPRTHRVVAVDDDARWDEVVRAAPTSSFAHLSGWREVISATMGHECLYRGVEDEQGALCAVLPIVRIRSRIFGSHLLSVPFLNEGGPIGDPGASSSLLDDAMALARQGSDASLVLRARHAPLGETVSSSKITVLLDLAPTEDEMWNGRFNSKFRTKIKRPMRDGMETRFGLDQVNAFYEVFAHNMRDLGTPVLPRAFFERIATHFPDISLVGVTYWNGQPVAAGWGFRWRDEFEMTWSSSRREFGNAKPNMLLYWDYMRELIARGVKVFNFGRSTPGSGPHEFKRAWGGVDVALPWYEWPAHAGAASTQRSRVMDLAVATWQRLPVAVTNRLGPPLARTLPWW